MDKKMRCTPLLILLFIVGRSSGQDQHLSYFIDQAMQHAPQLKTSPMEAEANKLDSKKSIAALTKPVLGTEVNYLLAPAYANDPANSGFKLNPSKSLTDYYGYDLSATNGGLYQGILSLEQPLFNRARVDAVTKQAELQNEMLDNNASLTRHELAKQVTDQYILCLSDIDQQKAIERVRKVTQQQIGITRKLSASGLARQGDYKILEIELKQQQTSLQSLQDGYRQHLLELYSLCGMKDTALIDLAPLDLDVQDDGPSISGFVNGYRLDSLSLGASEKLFDTRYRPTVSLYSSAGVNAVYAPDIYKRFGWEVGIRLSKTFFDGHQKELNSKRVKLLQQKAAVNTHFFKRQNENRKKALLQLINSISEQIRSLAEQEIEYDDLIQYYQKQMASGQSSVIDYLTVLRSSVSLALKEAALKAQRELAINNYNYWNW